MDQKYGSMDAFLEFCQYFGLFVFTALSIVTMIKVVTLVWRLYLKPGFKWRGGPDTWAVVTGSTDGIGLEYARQLAQKGYNLLLISRNQSKLDKVKEDIETKNTDCSVRVLALDFSRHDIYDTIDEEFSKLGQIHILVNNVGMIYPDEKPEYMCDIPDLNKFVSDILNVNVGACTKLTAMVLPRMLANGSGAIINLSSASAITPIPLLTLYSATKVYIDYFSRALHEEYSSRGIVVQCVLPCFVSTNMSYNIDTNLFVPSPPVYVKSALKTVGKESRTPGYFSHRWQSFTIFWCAVWQEFLGVNTLIRFHYFRLKNIRKRIYTKEEAMGLKGKVDEERVVLDINIHD